MSELTDAKVQFGLVPNDHWVQPPWINESRATAARAQMISDNVIYGGMSPPDLLIFIEFSRLSYRQRPVSVDDVDVIIDLSVSQSFRYRNMCRFNSGVNSQILVYLIACLNTIIFGSSSSVMNF